MNVVRRHLSVNYSNLYFQGQVIGHRVHISATSNITELKLYDLDFSYDKANLLQEIQDAYPKMHQTYTLQVKLENGYYVTKKSGAKEVEISSVEDFKRYLKDAELFCYNQDNYSEFEKEVDIEKFKNALYYGGVPVPESFVQGGTLVTRFIGGDDAWFGAPDLCDCGDLKEDVIKSIKSVVKSFRKETGLRVSVRQTEKCYMYFDFWKD